MGAPRRAGRGWVALVLAGTSPLTGCYTTQPLSTSPTPGTTVVLELTDRGRVALGDRIGPSADGIVGVVQTPNDTIYMIHVTSVKYLNGQSNKWSGEPLAVPASLVARARVQTFSRTRTAAIGVAVAAGIIAVFAKMNFFGLGGNGTDNTPPPPGGT